MHHCADFTHSSYFAAKSASRTAQVSCTLFIQYPELQCGVGCSSSACSLSAQQHSRQPNHPNSSEDRLRPMQIPLNRSPYGIPESVPQLSQLPQYARAVQEGASIAQKGATVTLQICSSAVYRTIPTKPGGEGSKSQSNSEPQPRDAQILRSSSSVSARQ